MSRNHIMNTLRRYHIPARLSLIFTLLLCFIGQYQPITASIPGPLGTFASAFTVQNISSNTANCSYKLYTSAGSIAFTSASFSLAAGTSQNTFLPSVAGAPDGQYTATVVCDQPVAGAINQSANGGANSGAAYRGIRDAEVGPTWYVPTIYNNYYNFYSNFVVHNPGANPVTVDITYYNSTGTALATTGSATIPAHGYVSFEQKSNPAFSINQAYSAKLVATGGNVAVSTNIYGDNTSAGMLYSYTPFASGANTAYAPMIMNNYYGYITSLVVQNVSASTATVNVSYSNGTSEPVATLLPGQAKEYYHARVGTSIPANNQIYAAKVSSDQTIVAVVNESIAATRRAASYTTFFNGKQTMNAPIVFRRYYDYNTGILCQNLGSAATSMTISYSGIGSTTTSGSIAPDANHHFYQPTDINLSDGYNGSAKITASQPIACVVNEDKNEGSSSTSSADFLYSYEATGE